MGDHLGYIRVSTTDQNTNEQLADVQLYRPAFIDRISGNSADRPELKKCLELLRDGDTLHVHSMDRLARNLVDLQTIVDQLTNIGVTIIFHQENLTFENDDNPVSKMMLKTMRAMADLDKSLKKERQMSGIAQALKKGIKFGPKPMTDDDEKSRQITELLQQGKTKKEVAWRLKMSRTTLYKFLDKQAQEVV